MAPKLVLRIKRALVEALGGSLLGDRAGQTDDRELLGFRPLSERSRKNKTRDLSMLSHKEMVDIGLFLYTANAFAEWLVDMPVALTVGQELGYSISIDHEKAGISPDEAKKLEAEIRKTLDPFWYHPAHNIHEKASEYARTFMVTGHLVLPVTAVNEVSGIPQFDLIDAAQIQEVDGLNGSAIVPGLVRYSPADTSVAKVFAMAVLQQAEDGRLLPQNPGELSVRDDIPKGVELKYEGLYFRHNKLLNSLRGVGYLMAVADWVDALDQFTWTTLDRAKLRNAIVYHLKLTGSVGLNLKEETQKLTTAIASPGTVYGSNEGVTVEAVAAKLEGADNVVLGRMILTHVLGSKSMPESWYGSGSESNRSTAETQTDVTYKALLALQNRFRGIFRTMLWCAYDSAQAKHPAVYPKRTTSPWLTLEPNMTVLQERDISRVSAGIAQLAAGLGSAMEDRLISEKTSRKTFLDVVGKTTGGAVELDEEEARIESETAEREERAEKAAAEMARKRIGSELDDPEQRMPPPPQAGTQA